MSAARGWLLDMRAMMAVHGTEPAEYLQPPPNRLVPPHPHGADYEVGERYWHDGAWWVIVTAQYDGGWRFGAKRLEGEQFEPDEWDRAADRAHQSREQYVAALYAETARGEH